MFQVMYSCNVIQIMLCNGHQPLRYSAKPIHAVNGGSATEVDGYWKPEVRLSMALDTNTSKAGRALTQNCRGALASSWLGMEGSQAGIRSGKMTQNNLLHLLWIWQWSPDVPSLEFPCQFRPDFMIHTRSGFAALVHLVEMWLWCQKPQKCSLKWLFFNCEEPWRMSVFSQENPSSREHTVF